MKKILSLILVFIFTLNICGCNQTTTETETTNIDSETKEVKNIADETTVPEENTPETVMDMFDGERKVWFIVGKGLPGTTKNFELSYDNIVEAIFVTENQKIIEGYYFILPESPYINSLVDGENLKFKEENSEFKICKQYILSDFDNLSDEEILLKVSQNYADISKTYFLTPPKNSYTDLENIKFSANILPLKIKYSGDLDSSRNNFITETLSIFDENYYYVFEDISFLSSQYKYIDTILPTDIKNNEYVGITTACDCNGYNYHRKIITKNTYTNFGKLKLDSPEGATKLE